MTLSAGIRIIRQNRRRAAADTAAEGCRLDITNISMSKVALYSPELIHTLLAALASLARKLRPNQFGAPDGPAPPRAPEMRNS